MMKKFAVVVAALMGLAGTALAQKKEVTFAHQDMLVPWRTVMESGELEKLTGYKINWRMFGGGGDVIDRKSTRLNSSHVVTSRMPSSA